MLVSRSCTKTSEVSLVSPATRFVASESKTTKRPFREIAGMLLSPSPWAPLERTLTRFVVGVAPCATEETVTTSVSAVVTAITYLRDPIA